MRVLFQKSRLIGMLRVAVESGAAIVHQFVEYFLG
jgi:hypothetical protein